MPGTPLSFRSYRVLMIAPTSFFADYGCHVRILEEARILQQLGHSVTIVTYRNGQDVPDIHIERTLPIPWRKGYEVGASRHKIVFDALLGLKTLQLLARHRFDVIHAHLHEGALIGLVLGRLFRLPVVFDFQGSLTAEMMDHRFLRENSPFHSTLLRLETTIDRSSGMVLTSSAHARQLLLDKFGCRPERVQALPDCVNTDVFCPSTEYDPGKLAALRQQLGIPAERRLIVYLGLLAEYQGVGLLLDAMQELVTRRQDAHLLLMGFPNVLQYRQRAIDLGIGDRVTLTGRVPYGEAPAHLALGQVGAAPKMSLTEGAGKLLNYMAVGLPVVAFDTPVAREYLGSDGIYAEPGNPGSLAECLQEALDEVDESPNCSQRGRRLRQRAVQLFGWEPAGQQIAQLYAQARGEATVSEAPVLAHSARKSEAL
jgi:glycosyltransferase involved in cell wall biosynthesis